MSGTERSLHDQSGMRDVVLKLHRCMSPGFPFPRKLRSDVNIAVLR